MADSGQALREIHPKVSRGIVDAAIAAGSKAPYAFVVAISCDATKRSFDALEAAAKTRGVRRAELWTKEKLNDFLNEPKNSAIATFYFGDGSAIPGTVPLPVALDRSVGRDAPLLGRTSEVAELLAATGDIVIVGPAGSGKRRLVAGIAGRRFLTLYSDANAVAESIRLDRPTHVVLMTRVSIPAAWTCSSSFAYRDVPSTLSPPRGPSDSMRSARASRLRPASTSRSSSDPTWTRR